MPTMAEANRVQRRVIEGMLTAAEFAENLRTVGRAARASLDEIDMVPMLRLRLTATPWWRFRERRAWRQLIATCSR